jgi:frataxin
MDESEFHALAGATLEALMDRIDEVAAHVLEAALIDEVLTITREDDSQYVLNRHTINRELWLSSPKSGAGHYVYDKVAKAWTDRRRGRDLYALLENELSAAAGCSLRFA